MPGAKDFLQKSRGDERDPIVDFGRGMYGWQISIVHIDTGIGASFPAFLTDFSETFTSDWNEESYFGRNDKIGRHAGTSRTINVSLGIPSYSAKESRLNMHQVEHLIATMYPSYEEVGTSGGQPIDVLYAYPLVKVKFANLIRKGPNVNSEDPLDSGLAGWIPNLNISPDLEAGFHSVSKDTFAGDILGAAHNSSDPKATDKIYGNATERAGGVLFPKVWNINFSLRVVHEHKLGWKNRRWIAEPRKFPYGAYTGFTEANTDYGTAVVSSEFAEEIAKKELAKILQSDELAKLEY